MEKLTEIVRIVPRIETEPFQKWFSYSHNFTNEEFLLLENLLLEHRVFLLSYSEDELKIKFIGPILNSVKFRNDKIKDWYQRPLKGKVNNVIFSGYTDFMVAEGMEEPKKPYFFIQEFKKSKIDMDPKNQLLAEMLVAINQNNEEIMRGAFIIGSHWQFMILQKSKDFYEYFISKSFDSLWLEDLKQIYTNLQAVKNLYCQLFP